MAQAFWRAINLETVVLMVDCLDASTRASLPGASVYLNSRYAGQTDVEGQWRQAELLPRQYVMEVECQRYQPWRASIRIISQEEALVTVELLREPKGELIVARGAPGAKVELGGEKVGTTDETGRLYLDGIAAGRRQLKIYHPKYHTAESEVEVGIGDLAFHEVKLTPKEANRRGFDSCDLKRRPMKYGVLSFPKKTSNGFGWSDSH